MEEWLDKLNDRLETLKAIGPEKLKAYELEYKYSWTTIIDKWDTLNDISEKAKVQDARAKSRNIQVLSERSPWRMPSIAKIRFTNIIYENLSFCRICGETNGLSR